MTQMPGGDKLGASGAERGRWDGGGAGVSESQL